LGGPLRRINLRKTLFILPNLVTVSAIFCGFDSIRLSAGAAVSTERFGETADDFYRAALLIIFAMFFDMLDGRVARMTKTQSAFGLQMDSLADAISFGVAPAMLVYGWSLNNFGVLGLFISFLFAACAVIRLARFNVLTMGEDGKPQKPSKYFLGLPTPGAAGILVSVVVANHAALSSPKLMMGEMTDAKYAGFVLALTLVLSFLMVSNVQFRSFKEIKLNTRTALFVAFAVGSSLFISTQMKPAFVLVWLLGFYVLMGIFETLWNLPGRIRASRTPPPPPTELPPPTE
jgi:CDP-diacylglycerol---serine O-phosphatidyltransferase